MGVSLNDLNRQLKEAEIEFNSFFHKVHIEPSFDHPFEAGGRLDGFSGDGTNYGKLNYGVDPKKVAFAWERVNILKARINSFKFDQWRDERLQREREAQDEIFRRQLILDVAKGLYKKYLIEFRKSGIFEKASHFLSGNKIFLSSDDEILEIYGKVAVDGIVSPVFNEINAAREKQLEGVRKDFGGEPMVLESAIRQTNTFFDGEISRVRESYQKSLAGLLSSNRTGERRR